MKLSFPARIYVIALVLRFIPILLLRGLGIGLDDMFQYDMLARSLASGNGYRWYAQEDLKLLEPYIDFDTSTTAYDPGRGILTSFRAPLYPAFLAVIYSIFGVGADRFFVARLIQAVFLGAPLAPFTYLISRRLLPNDEEQSRSSGYIVALYPMLLVYPLGLVTENLFIVLLLCSFLYLLKSLGHGTGPNLFLAGLFLGLTTLTRSVILPFSVSTILYLGYVYRRKAILVVIAFMVTIVPWIVRNSLLHHRLTGIETSMGYNLYLGYHPQGDGSFSFGPSLDLLAVMDDSLRDSIGTEKALVFIQNQPGRFLPLLINRLGFFFGLEKRAFIYFYSNNILGYIPIPFLILIFSMLLLPFIILSLASAISLPFLRRNNQTTLLGLLFLMYLLPHILILSEDRFHLALIPFLAILATRGLHCLANGHFHSTLNRGLLWVSLGVVLLLVTNWGFELYRDADKITALLGPNGNRTYLPY